MRTSSMKLTSLLLSLMLASGALGAPVPIADGVPGVNFPTVGSGFIDGAAPGTTDQVNTGLKGGAKPPAGQDDPVTTATEAAAAGNPDAAKGAHARQVPNLPPPLGDILGGIGGAAQRRSPDDISDADADADVDSDMGDILAGLSALDERSPGPPGSIDPPGITSEINSARTRAGANGKRSTAPPTGDLTGAAGKVVDGVKKDGTNNLSIPPPNTVGKRSPGTPLDGVKVGSGAEVLGDKLEDTAAGKAPLSGPTGTAGTLAGRQAPGCKPDPANTSGTASCLTDAVNKNADLNSVNDLNGAAKGATNGGGTATPPAGSAEPPKFAGTTGPAAGLASGATDGVQTPPAGGLTPPAGDAATGGVAPPSGGAATGGFSPFGDAATGGFGLPVGGATA